MLRTLELRFLISFNTIIKHYKVVRTVSSRKLVIQYVIQCVNVEPTIYERQLP